MRTELLPVPLTYDEQLQRGKDHAALCQRIAIAKDDAKEEAKGRKLAIKKLETEECELRDVVNTGKERRPVEVRDEYDKEAKLVVTIRLDTGEVVSSRPMTSEELLSQQQGRLFALKGEGEGERV